MMEGEKNRRREEGTEGRRRERRERNKCPRLEKW